MVKASQRSQPVAILVAIGSVSQSAESCREGPWGSVCILIYRTYDRICPIVIYKASICNQCIVAGVCMNKSLVANSFTCLSG